MTIRREDIVTLGDKFFTDKEVEQVTITISFKDGGNIQYSKHKMELRRFKDE